MIFSIFTAYCLLLLILTAWKTSPKAPAPSFLTILYYLAMMESIMGEYFIY